jgi:hypothetical protein
MPRGNSNNIRLQLASQYPFLSQASGFATGSQEASNPIEQILSNVGYSPTSGFTPVANPGAIGADNGTLANNTNNAVQNIFALVRNASADATNRTEAAAAKRKAEEANAKAVAMQAKILEAQKKAALAALKTLPSGTSSPSVSQPQGSYPLTPMPKLPGGDTNKVKLPQALNLPDARPPVIAPPDNKKFKTKAPVANAMKTKRSAKRDPRKPGIQN